MKTHHRTVVGAALAVTAAAAFTFFSISAQSQPTQRSGPSPDEAALRAAGVGSDWWSRVLERIQASEYEASVANEGLQAPNRAQDLRTRFGPEGFTIIPRREAEPFWQWSWRTVAWGRDGECRIAGEAQLSHEGNRVTYARPGLVEWYENREEGLEQGFTVLKRPAGEGWLVVEGTLSGLRPNAELAGWRVEPGGQSVELTDLQGSPVLQVAQLVALDASGTRMPAWMEVESNLARILVDDRGATYPITIDPLWMGTRDREWSYDAPQDDCYFGYSVATAGDVNGDGFDDLLVGAPYYDAGLVNEGGAFLYLGSPFGPSTAASWNAQSNQVNAKLGWSVATAGDVNGDGYDDILVGAPLYDHGQVDEGASFAWLGSATGLGANGTPANADWTTEVSQVAAYFGAVVATAGDVNGDDYDDVIVSAPNYDRGETDEGEVYVFHGYSGGLHAGAAWFVDGDDSYGFFGTSVATAGDVNADGYDDVIIGAPHHTVDWPLEGVAYAWYGSVTGLHPSTSPADADWSYAGGQQEAYFGYSVATAGDVQGNGYASVVVGAPWFDNGQDDEGRAAVFSGGITGLSPLPSWTFELDQAEANMGWSVSTAGDVDADGIADLLVGVPYFDSGVAPTDAGAVFLYYGTDSGPLSAYRYFLGEMTNAGFGRAIGTAGDLNGDGFSEVVIGAPYQDGGVVRVFPGYGYNPRNLSPGSWVKEMNDVGAQFGYSIAAAGDVNGDGYGDIVVGSPWHEFREPGEGAVYVFPGTRDGPSVAPICTGFGGQVDAHLGSSVAGVGDVNGDGYDDLAVGAPDYDSGETDEGLAVVQYGSASGPASFIDPSVADWTAQSDQGGAHLGGMVAGAGDVNGDGFAELLVGAHAYDNGSTNEGVVLLWEGGEAGLGEPGDASNADWAAQSNLASALFGAAGGTAGDVNGDGYSDIVVGAYNASLGEASEGCVYAWHGGPEGMGPWGTPENADWMIESNQANARFGFAVSTAGDVNGDGYSDVVVGAYSYDDGTETGGVYFFGGSATGLETTASWEEHYPGANSAFGYAVAPAGDVDGDGYGDFMVGAKLGEREGYADEGLAYVYTGSPDGPGWTYGWVSGSGQTNSFYGAAVAGAGDANGDGFDDIIVGAPRYDNGQTDEGRVYFYFGNEHYENGDGRDRLPRQARSDGATLISRLGISDSETSFRLRIRGRTPAGRGKVRLQWEVKPLGVPFDGTGLGEATVDQDTGVPVTLDGSYVELDEPVTGLGPGTVYLWRMRILTDSPFFARSRWFWMSGNGLTQWSLRTAGTASGVASPDAVTLSDRLRLGPAFPNPFQAFTSLSLESIGTARAQVTVHDPTGRRVSGLWDGSLDAGSRTVTWDGQDDEGHALPEGVYFIRAEADGETLSRSVIRVR